MTAFDQRSAKSPPQKKRRCANPPNAQLRQGLPEPPRLVHRTPVQKKDLDVARPWPPKSRRSVLRCLSCVPFENADHNRPSPRRRRRRSSFPFFLRARRSTFPHPFHSTAAGRGAGRHVEVPGRRHTTSARRCTPCHTDHSPTTTDEERHGCAKVAPVSTARVRAATHLALPGLGRRASRPDLRLGPALASPTTPFATLDSSDLRRSRMQS